MGHEGKRILRELLEYIKLNNRSENRTSVHLEIIGVCSSPFFHHFLSVPVQSILIENLFTQLAL